MLPQFSYSVAERHKVIKGQTESPEPNPTDLKNQCKELRVYIGATLQDILKLNHDQITSYFAGRSKYSPRVIIKGEEDGKIKDLYRDDPEYSTEQEIGENSGSDHVVKKGKAFVCNDIPTAIKNERYKNPRIDCVKVRGHLQRHGEFKSHADWVDCWYDNESESGDRSKPSPESCYRSTLIIPMTLLRNQLDEEFRKHFKIPRPSDDKKLGRAIYGLLCLDHRDPNYFNEELDIKAGYMFADFISLYLINELMYTDYSKTYRKAMDMVRSEGGR
jgi:hypothetical protein